jgi:diguanylate cyclase (GGDEF)-like protein/PAS domain S-box-containing protein
MIVYYFLHHSIATIILCFGLIVFLLVPFIFKITAKLGLCREIILVNLYLLLTILTYTENGLGSPTPYWLILLPMLGLTLGSVRSAIIWMFIVAITLVMFYLASVFDIQLPLNPVTNLPLLIFLSISGLTFTVFGLSYFFESAKIEGFIQLEKAAQRIKDVNSQLEKSEEVFHDAMENAPIGMAIVSLKGDWLEVNGALCDLLGYSKTEFQRYSVEDLTYPEDLKITTENNSKLLEGKIGPYRIEKRYVKKNGQSVWVLLGVSLAYDKDNNPRYFIIQIEDIQSRKENEKIMMDLHKQTQSMLIELQQHEKITSIITKMNDMLQKCDNSDEAYSIIKLAAQEIFPTLSGGLAIIEDQAKDIRVITQWGKQELLSPFFSAEKCWALRGGEVYVVNDPKKEIVCYHFQTAPEGGCICLPLNVQGKVIGILVLYASSENLITYHDQQHAITFSDVIKLSLSNIKLREELREQAIRDPLSGLYNRRFLKDVLSRYLFQVTREQNSLCIAMLDIDNFKKFNDMNGHEAGDEVIKFVGTLLNENFRGSDIASRFGGEEFIVSLMHTKLDDAYKKLEDIRKKFKNTNLHYQSKKLPNATISIGLAEAPLHAATYEGIIQAADEALYAAKKAGRDQVQIFHPPA